MAEDTLARMFWSRVEKSADRPAQQFKRGADWKTLTWREVGDTVRELALGLIALGCGRGDAVALLSTSRAEWVQADFAIFSVGGVTVPVYPSYPPDLVAYVVNDSGARSIIVEDATQLAKVLEAREQMPALQHVVVMAGYDAPQPRHEAVATEPWTSIGSAVPAAACNPSMFCVTTASRRPRFSSSTRALCAPFGRFPSRTVKRCP